MSSKLGYRSLYKLKAYGYVAVAGGTMEIDNSDSCKNVGQLHHRHRKAHAPCQFQLR